MRTLFILAAVLLSFGFAWAEMGFDEKYGRDYNIFNPANQYAPDGIVMYGRSRICKGY